MTIYTLIEDIDKDTRPAYESDVIYPCTERSYFKGRHVQHMYLDQKGYQTIREAAGGDKYDHQPPPDRYDYYEGDSGQLIGDFIS